MLSNGNQKALKDIKESGSSFEDFLKKLKKCVDGKKLGSVVVQSFSSLGIQECFYKNRQIIVKFNSNHGPTYLMKYRSILRICNSKKNTTDESTKVYVDNYNLVRQNKTYD